MRVLGCVHSLWGGAGPLSLFVGAGGSPLVEGCCVVIAVHRCWWWAVFAIGYVWWWTLLPWVVGGGGPWSLFMGAGSWPSSPLVGVVVACVCHSWVWW